MDARSALFFYEALLIDGGLAGRKHQAEMS
jgi:hypothetical protein